MLRGLGVDIIEIERIAATVNRFGERFLNRVYTQAELRYCRGRAENLAGRFAAKEAVSKALGTGIRRLSWQDIEVDRGPMGRPVVRLSGRAGEWARRLSIVDVQVTISHSRGLAVACAAVSGDPP